MLALFIYCGARCQQISTIGEIYNYEVGDVFHITDVFTAPGYDQEIIYNKEIVEKYSSNPDYITYVCFAEKNITVNGGPVEYEFFIDTTTYGPLYYPINSGSIDTVYSSPELYNGRMINYHEWWSTPYNLQWQQWVNGCGQALWHYDDYFPNGVGFDVELVYYKKGDEEWGTPHVVVGTPEYKIQFGGVKAYPNPFTTSIIIEYTLDGKSNIEFSIFNSIGEMVHKAEETYDQGTHQVTWFPHHLPAGLYYAVLRLEE
ncbi:MAG TPA: T9SS type A sorting domain-containing protein, partial [Bacteroidales bacterium]|nr:T9SS type A sorting domain-containing protein [Bacteroidales bacterium]